MLFHPCHSFWRVTTMNSFVFIPKSFPIFALLTAVRMAARTVSFFSFWFKLLLVHFTPCFQCRYMAYMLQILANFSDFTSLKYFLNCPFLNTSLLWNLPCVCICMPCICIYCTLSNSSKACLSSALCSRSSSSFLVILESATKLKKKKKHSSHLDISASKWDEYESVFICKKASQSSLAVKFLRNE